MIQAAWTALFVVSLMPKRFEGGISIQYKNVSACGRARSVGYLGKEMANKIDRQFR
jgi:hypothetical protein